MTILEIWLICILCYILIGIIWAIAHFFKSVNDVEKALKDNGIHLLNYGKYYGEFPTTIDGIIIIFLWPFYLIVWICIGICEFVNFVKKENN